MNRHGSFAADRGSVLPIVIAGLAGLCGLTLLLSYSLQGAALRLRLGAVAHRLAVLEAGAALAGRATCTFVPSMAGLQVVGCRDDGREILIEVAAEAGWPYPAPIRAAGRVGYGAEWDELAP